MRSGGGVSGKTLIDKKYDELLGLIEPAKVLSGDLLNYKRALMIDYDDLTKAVADCSTSTESIKNYYNIKFRPINFKDYAELYFSFRSYPDEEATYDPIRSPQEFGNKIMDQYDVINLYANDLGLKCVPFSEEYGDHYDSFDQLAMSTIEQYFFNDINMDFDNIINQIGIFGGGVDCIGTVGHLEMGLIIGHITFYNEYSDEYKMGYKNCLSLRAGK